MPSDNAQRWKKPRPCFDIDDGVEGLIKADLLRGDFQGDPFLTARCYLGRAITIARKEKSRRKDLNALRSDLERAEKTACALKERLQQVAEEAEILLATPVTMWSETLNPKVESERRAPAVNIRRPLLSLSRRRSLVGDVQELEAALRMHRRNITAANDAAFRPAFIEQMVYSWVSLTGKSPAHSDERFLAFVISAHATTLKKSSVDLDLPFYVEPWDPAEEKARERRWVDKKDCDPWGFQVRKTLERMSRRPEESGAYRYEQGLVPPIVDVQPSLARRKFGPTPEQFDEETKRLTKEMLADGECSSSAAQILWCEYHLAGRTLQARYFGKGKVKPDEPTFTPADALARIWRSGQSGQTPPAARS
jgi:hypothetical protein